MPRPPGKMALVRREAFGHLPAHPLIRLAEPFAINAVGVYPETLFVLQTFPHCRLSDHPQPHQC